MRAIQALLITLSFIPALISCKKDSSHASKHCRIIGIYDTVYEASGARATVTRIFYDNDGRIAYQNIKWSTDSAIRIFMYHDSSIIITSSNTRLSSDTVHLNSKGVPTLIKTGYSGPSSDSTSYSYDGAGLLTSSTSGNAYIKTTTTYTYDNGDCVKAVTSDGDVFIYTYYTDFTTRDGDPRMFEDIYDYGVPTVRNKHLIRSYQYGNYVWQYSYTFDNAGRIETVVNRTDTYVAVRRYEYDCE